MHRLSKLRAAISNPILFWVLIRHRVLAASEHRPVLDGKLRTIVDVGANRGQFALAASVYCPHARIFAFEPLPVPSQVFKAVFDGKKNVRLREVAIGSEATTAAIHISKRDDSSSLLPMAQLQEHYFPGTGEVGALTVPVGTLVSEIDENDLCRPAMLKIDVQGYELEVLKGSEKHIGRFDCIYVECSFVELYSGQPLISEIVVWLADHEFFLAGIYNVTYADTGSSIQADFLFKRNAVLRESLIK